MSVVLFDMDYDESLDKYKHQYQVMKEPNDNPDTLISETEKWVVVSDITFDKHKEDMGMEIARKEDGVLKRETAPVGQAKYVSNKRYGSWQNQNDGTRMWVSMGQYMFMRSMFGYGHRPVYYGGWNNYHSNYYGYGRSYYGSGSTRYGTTSSTNKRSPWNSKPSAFKQSVRSKVTRSSSISRSNSRSSGSSYRSRGGGSGK